MKPTKKKTMFVYRNFNNRVMLSLQEFQSKKEFHDVKIECGQYVFTTQKIILAALSPYFYKLLKNVKCNCTIKVNGVSKNIMTKALQFMYCGTVKLDKTLHGDFMKLLKTLEIINPNTLSANTKVTKEEIKQFGNIQQAQSVTDVKQVIKHDECAKKENHESERFSTPTIGFDDGPEKKEGNLSSTSQVDDNKLIKSELDKNAIEPKRPKRKKGVIGCARFKPYKKHIKREYFLRSRKSLP